jgi:hypothetical protein
MFTWGRLYMGFGSNPYQIFSELLDLDVLCTDTVQHYLPDILYYYLLYFALCLFNPPKAEKKRRKFFIYFYLLVFVAVSALFRSKRS